MYKQLIHLNIKKSKNPIKKWTEDLKRLSSKESMQIARRQMKRCSTLQIINKTQVKPQWGTPYTGLNGHNQKKQPTTSTGEGIRKRNTFTLWWKCKVVQALRKQYGGSLKKTKIELPYDPAVPWLSTDPEETKPLIQKDTCTSMFITALFIIA